MRNFERIDTQHRIESPRTVPVRRHPLKHALGAAPRVAKVAILGLALCAVNPQALARPAASAVGVAAPATAVVETVARNRLASVDGLAIAATPHDQPPCASGVERPACGAAAGADDAAAGSNWIGGIKRRLAAFAFFVALAAHATEPPGPWGIDDPQIANGVLRTEYNDPQAGTAGHPLNIDCTASANPEACAAIDAVFRASNSFTNGAIGPGSSYWMLTVNNDKTFVLRCEEYGPPDQSVPIDDPGAGLAGVGVSPGPRGSVIDLDVDQVNFRNPCGSEAAPFVGFGAHWGRGNSTPIGYLNAEGTVTNFSSRLVEFATPGGFVYARHWLFAIAAWGGVRHFVAVHLFALDGDEAGTLAPPPDNGVTTEWKWPYRDSWYYPGASITVFPAWAVGLPTLQRGTDVRYAVDWQRVFEKAWPDMPREPIAIEGVAFANEIAGAVHLHVAVSGVHQTSSSPGQPNVSFKVNGRTRLVIEPGESLRYDWHADNALGVYSAWQTNDPRCGSGLTSGAWHAASGSGAFEQAVQAGQSGCRYDVVVTAYSFNGIASDGITVVVR